MKIKVTGVCLLMVLAILFASILHAQIVESEGFSLDSDGNGSVPLKLTTAVEQVAGIQGRVLFDPSCIGITALTMSPNQPSSFILRSHLVNPGEMNYVVYSPTDVLRKEFDILVCQVKADVEVHSEGISSVLIFELGRLGTPDLKIHNEANAYINAPLLMPAQNAAEHGWLKYF